MHPAIFVATSFTVYKPDEIYGLLGFVITDPVLFPKSHKYDTAPVVVLVKFTFRGGQTANVSLIRNAAAGDGPILI